MSLFPWTVGQTAPVWALTWQDDTGAAIDLTGSTITLSLRRAQGQGSQAGGGTVTLTTPAAGQFTYAPVAGDFTAPDVYDVQFKAVLASGKVLFHDPVRGIVLAAT